MPRNFITPINGEQMNLHANNISSFRTELKHMSQNKLDNLFNSNERSIKALESLNSRGQFTQDIHNKRLMHNCVLEEKMKRIANPSKNKQRKMR